MAPEKQAFAVSVVFSEHEIRSRIAGLADEISAAMGPDVVLVLVLKGSLMFSADLARALHRAGVAPEIDMLTLSSYVDDTASSGRVRLVQDITCAIDGRDVLVVDDILETGLTLAFARDHLLARGARTVRSCVLLDKSVHRTPAARADFVGFECPDVFVVGYGMDLAGRYRELPFIGKRDT